MPVDKGGFGAPKPLGKKKLSESAVLESEAREMEQRLRMLQTRMATQADEDAKVVKVGGSRWRGARTDKGSVTRYNHTVQERHGKVASSNDYQESMSTLRPSASAVAKKETREKQMRASAAQESKQQGAGDVESWGVGEVGTWLEALGLPQYADVFRINEITGAVLVDLSLEDLDYMEVKTLGHRKTLLKAVAKLKAPGEKAPQRRPSRTQQQGQQQGQGCMPQTSKSLEELPTGGMGEARSSSQQETQARKHWSHVDPIVNNEVTGNGQVPINPGDGTLDEAAEQRAFMEAVMEWRQGAAEEVAQVEEKGGDDSMWHNPWGGGGEEKGEGKEESKGGEDGGLSVLTSGDMDEEAERRAFQAAVAEWRGDGGAGAGSSSSSDGVGARAAPNQSPSGRGGGRSTSGSAQQAGPTGPDAPLEPMATSHATAKALAQQMEAEHEASIKALSERRSEMEAKLRAASSGPSPDELDERERRAKRMAADLDMADDDDDDDDDDGAPTSRVALQFVGTDTPLSEDFKEDYYVVEEEDSD